MAFERDPNTVSYKEEDLKECERNLKLIVGRARKAAFHMMQIVYSSANEAGVSCLLGFQMHRLLLAKNPDGIPSNPPLLFIMNLLPREPLRRHKLCSHTLGQGCSLASMSRDFGPRCSLAWMFAAAILQPDFFAELADFRGPELQFFLLYISKDFYETTARLLKNVRTQGKGSGKEDQATLIEHLETIYSLIKYHNVQGELAFRWATMMTASLCARIRVMSKTIITLHAKGFREIDKQQGKERIFASLKPPSKFHSMFVHSMCGEGGNHVQAFTRHWLRKLKAGHRLYSQVIVRNFHLNALRRIDHKDEIEDEGQLPSYLPQHYLDNVLVEAFTTFHSLHQQGNKAPGIQVDIKESLSPVVRRLMDDNMSILCRAECGWWETRFVSTGLDELEEEVTRIEAKRDSKKPKDFSLIPLDDLPKSKLSSLGYWLNVTSKPRAPFLQPSKALTSFSKTN